MDANRRAMLVRSGSEDGKPLGSSGRGRVKIINQPGEGDGYALVEGAHPAGEPRIRDHVHMKHEETFLVIEGHYRVRLDDQILFADAGDYVFVPRGTAHTYCNVGPGLGRLLNIISPADGVELLAELGDLGGAPIDDVALTELHARHSAVLVEPLEDW